MKKFILIVGVLLAFEAGAYGASEPKNSKVAEGVRSSKGVENANITMLQESTLHSCKKLSFKFEGRNAIIVFPKEPRDDKAWLWVPAFFDRFPIAEKAFLAQGFHLVYGDFTSDYANYDAVDIAKRFHSYIRNTYELNPKAVLEGLSRGGAFSINFANKNPDDVVCLYLDAPVCDFASWPSKKSKLWKDLCKKWKVKDIDNVADFYGNPINNVSEIAKAQIPIIIVSGDSDKTVPHKENAEVILARYKAMGGVESKLILEVGKDHHPHGLKDPTPVVEFAKKAYDSLN